MRLGSALGLILLAACRPADLPFTERASTFLVAPGENGCVWWTDGTVSGTRELTSADRRGVGSSVTVDGRLFFAHRNDLWTTDGTPEGTRSVKGSRRPWYPGREGDRFSPRGLVAAGGRAYFLIEEELWTSDGTAEGTRLVWEKLDEFADGAVGLVAAGGYVYFFADAPRADPLFRGRQALWLHDPSTGATRIVEGDYSPDRIAGQGGSRRYGATPEWQGRIATLREWLIFPGRGDRVVSADSAAAGLLREKDDDTSTDENGQFQPGCELVLFTHGSELWATDATREGTRRLVEDLSPGQRSWVLVSDVACVDRTTVFATRMRGTGGALWRSDGTSEGTVRIAEWSGDRPAEMVAVGERVFFTRGDSEGADELWVSDLGSEGTRVVPDACAPGRRPHSLTPLGARRVLYVCGEDEPRVSDGDAAGTFRLLPG